MIGVSSALAPAIDQIGLQLAVGPAKVWLNGTLFTLNPSVVFLLANSTSYVYLVVPGGTIGVNNTGYPATNAVPISKAVTNLNAVISITDDRPDFTSAVGGGGGPNFSDAEVPSGAINGVNTTYTLAFSPSPAASLILIRNGIVLTAGGVDYTLSGQTITMVSAPLSGDSLAAWYRH